MRSIQVDLDVFAEIWSRRKGGEDSENEILRRVLLNEAHRGSSAASSPPLPSRKPHAFDSKEVKSSKVEVATPTVKKETEIGKIRWVDDIQMALKSLGGQASLHSIYKEVESQRRTAGRSTPRTLEAVIRRTLEDHSSDSANFRGRDLFQLLGRGEWGLR